MSLGNTILKYRKELGITQESLARQLEVTNQAVSKWESDQCCPDVMLLPRLADIFDVTLDELFDRKRPGRSAQMVDELPWPDDSNLRGVLYRGRQLIDHGKGPGFELSFSKKLVGDIYSNFTVVCGDVTGSVDAGGNVQCGLVTGSIDAGNSVQCEHITGDVDAGRDVRCGTVEGNVGAGKDVRCGTVEGNVDAGHNVTCGDVMGNVDAGSSVQCGSVGGNIDAGGGVTIKK